MSQVARGQRRLPRAAGPLIRVNASLGRRRRSGLPHLFQGSGGTLSKNLQGDSPLSSPLLPRNIWRCSHAISCSPMITCLTGPLSIIPVIEATPFSWFYSALASQFVQRLSSRFRLRSLASLFPKALYFPAPASPAPSPHTWSSKAEANLTANNQVQDESSWPEVRASQAQPPKPEDCVSFKRQTINRAKPQENT